MPWLARHSSEKLILIGASRGGTEAIREVLVRPLADSPAVPITQHMPPGFTRSFAARLDSLCSLTVREAAGGERVLPGHAYVAPWVWRIRLARSGANYVIELDDGPPVNRHKLSLEALFKSAAAFAWANALGVTLEMKCAGNFNIAQDEARCVVFGMSNDPVSAAGWTPCSA